MNWGSTVHHDLNLGLHAPKKLAEVRSTHEERSDKIINKNNHPES